MKYEVRTQEEILKELQEYSQTQESRVEGTFEYDCFATNAIEFQKFSIEMAECYRQGFGDTATGEYLEMRAAEHGVVRRKATKSKGKVRVEGTGLIREGTLFSTTANVRFAATESIEVEGEGEVMIEAQVAGESGNVSAGTIVKMPLNVSGIHRVTNEAATFDGYDEEDDETFRERYLLKVRRPATSGNPQEYAEWALSIAGVGAATCLRNWNGRGTVKVIIADATLNLANEELIRRVDEYIQRQRPIGAEVTVVSGEPLTIDVQADIVGTVDINAYKKAVTKYFNRLLLYREVDYTSVSTYEDVVSAGYVSAAIIGKMIITDGGADDYDYNSLRLNGENKDIALSAEEIPLIGKVTFKQTVSG